MVPVVRPPLRAGPVQSGLMQRVVDLPIGPVRDPGQHLPLPAQVLLEQHGVRTPDHAHAGASAGLDAGHAVLEHEAFLRVDDGFALGAQVVVDALEREEVDVRGGLASPLGYPGVVAQDAARGGEGAEEVGQVRRLEAVVDGVGRGGERELGVGVLERLEQQRDAGEGLRGREELRLEGGLLGGEGGAGDGQLRPGVEDLGGLVVRDWSG